MDRQSELIVSSGFLVFRRNPQWSFLLMKHADRWDLPKGHCDPGETELETAFRELNEETGIGPTQIEVCPDFLWECRYQLPIGNRNAVPRNKKLVIFLAIAHTIDQIKPTEHLGYQWFSWPPQHSIQIQTVDPLLKSVGEYFSMHPEWLNR